MYYFTSFIHRKKKKKKKKNHRKQKATWHNIPELEKEEDPYVKT